MVHGSYACICEHALEDAGGGGGGGGGAACMRATHALLAGQEMSESGSFGQVSKCDREAWLHEICSFTLPSTHLGRCGSLQ